MFGITWKSLFALFIVVPYHAEFLNENNKLYGPVQGKFPQSSKLAQLGIGDIKLAIAESSMSVN